MTAFQHAWRIALIAAAIISGWALASVTGTPTGTLPNVGPLILSAVFATFSWFFTYELSDAVEPARR